MLYYINVQFSNLQYQKAPINKFFLSGFI